LPVIAERRLIVADVSDARVHRMRLHPVSLIRLQKVNWGTFHVGSV
jgi:hypothetical protein